MNFLKSIFIIPLLVCNIISVNTKAQKILFDASKAQTAGNADWVIDEDVFNLKWSPNAATGGNEGNAQKTPTPSQAGITANTNETYWTGALSSWGVDCAKAGWQVETLPYTNSFTYGNTSNNQDLSNYNAVIICEPNIAFTTTEKTAILNFVQNGGGLFMIADHMNSDRNNDNIDSRQVWNDLMNGNPFGIYFDSVDVSETTTNVANLSTDTILNGSYGNVTTMKLSGSSTITINKTKNATAKGLVYKTSANNTGNTNIYVASCYYGKGKVVALSDSSPADDSTGDVNDVLYNGYMTDANGNHRKLLMNATYWLMAHPTNINTAIQNLDIQNNDIIISPNPSANFIQLQTNLSGTIRIIDVMGKCVLQSNEINKIVDIHNLQSGIYFLQLITSNGNVVKKFLKN